MRKPAAPRVQGCLGGALDRRAPSNPVGMPTCQGSAPQPRGRKVSGVQPHSERGHPARHLLGLDRDTAAGRTFRLDGIEWLQVLDEGFVQLRHPASRTRWRRRVLAVVAGYLLAHHHVEADRTKSARRQLKTECSRSSSALERRLWPEAVLRGSAPPMTASAS